MSIFAEKISGAKKNEDRAELMSLISFAQSNTIQRVIITELSRLGRNPLEVLKSIELFNEHKISLYIQNYNIETLTDNGEVNPMSQFLITILAEVSRMERKTIRERVSSGYNNHIKNGGSVGRKIGYKKTSTQMMEQYPTEIKYLKKQRPLREIYRLTGTSINTLRKVKVII